MSQQQQIFWISEAERSKQFKLIRDTNGIGLASIERDHFVITFSDNTFLLFNLAFELGKLRYKIESTKLVSNEETFDEIYDLLRERLRVVGLIRPNDAWNTCRGKTHRGYATIVQYFTHIMGLMIEQGKAKKIKRGLYEILIPDTK